MISSRRAALAGVNAFVGHARAPSPRAVVTAVFFAFAIGIGLWAGAIPALKRQAGLDAAGLGMALTLHTVAYIAAMVSGGQFARIVPPRRLMLAAMAVQTAALGAMYGAQTPLALTLGLVVMGLGAGLLDLAMNTEGTAVERELGRPVLLSMHAAASGAFALGALAGSVLSATVSPQACLVPVLLVMLPAALAVWRLGPRVVPPAVAVPAVAATVAPAASAMPAGLPQAEAVPATASPAEAPGAGAGRIGGLVALLGVIIGLSAAAEMSAQMWSATFLERQAAELAAWAGAGAAFFAGCQSLTRLFGDALRQRFGDQRVITRSLLLAAVGFATVAASDSFALSVLGFALVGLGTACIVPCCFAQLARLAPQRAAAALGSASLVAGLIRMPTPLYLGFVAEAWGDAAAFAGVAAGLLIGLVLAQRGLRGDA